MLTDLIQRQTPGILKLKMRSNIWYNASDRIFIDLMVNNHEVVDEICRFANWLMRRKINSVKSSSDLRQVMDSAIIHVLKKDDIKISSLSTYFHDYFQELFSAPKINFRYFESRYDESQNIDMEIDIKGVFSCLSKVQVDIIVMHIYEEKTMGEIAQIMNITKGSAYAHYDRAKKTMKEHLKAGGYY